MELKFMKIEFDMKLEFQKIELHKKCHTILDYVELKFVAMY